MARRMAAGVLGAVLVVLGSGGAAAGTLAIRTPSLVPDTDGYLYCQVVAHGPRPIEIVAKIVTAVGTDVTDFGTGFRASPVATRDGYYAEETAGSLDDGARMCTVTLKGARRRDVDVTLTAHDAGGNVVATVQAP